MSLMTRAELDQAVQNAVSAEVAVKRIVEYLTDKNLLGEPLTAQEIDALPDGSVLQIGGTSWEKRPAVNSKSHIRVFYSEWHSSTGEVLISAHALTIKAFNDPIELVRYGSVYERTS